MPTLRMARLWHGATFTVVTFALVAQFALVVQGGPVLVDGSRPDVWVRLAHFASYFTIQSNLLVAVGVGLLALRPDRDGPGFRWVRLSGLVAITITGLVHFFLLRPLLELTGFSLFCDHLLHLVVPAMTVIGWTVFGPRPRLDRTTIGYAYLWPLAWLVWTLVVAEVTGWVPYPFLNVDVHGWPPVLGVLAGIVVLFTALVAGIAWVDRRARPRGLSTGADRTDAPTGP